MRDAQTYRQHARSLLVLGLPLAGSNIAHIAIGFTDTMMLGWYSVEALAAQVISWSFFFVVLIAGSGFAMGVMPLVAKHAEAGEVTELRRVTRMGLLASIVFGILSLPLLLSGEVVFGWLGQKPEILPLAGTYMAIVGWAIFPMLIVMVLRSYLSALERTQVVFWVTVTGAVLNGVLNWALIFGNFGAPELGIKGAAIASLTVNAFEMLALAVYIRLVEPSHKLFQRLWRVDGGALARVVRLGWPISLTMLAESSLFSASAVLMGWLGTIPLAAHGIALNLAAVTFVVHLGLSNAATVRVGRAMGRRDPRGLRDGGNVAIIMSLMMAVIGITLFVSFPETLTGLFVGRHEVEREAIIAAASSLLLIAAVFQTFDGLQVVGLGLLRGMQDTAVPMIYAAIAYWLVGMPISYVLGFPLGLGGVGVWSGLVIGLAVAGILLIGRFRRRARAWDGEKPA